MNLKLKDMKKAIVINALMLTCLTVFQSCKKSEDIQTSTAIPTTVAVELKSNQTYTYTLPAVSGKQSYSIAQESAHNATASITADASGNMQLIYTPALNYTGTDMILVSTETPEGCNEKKPGHRQIHSGKPHREGEKPEHEKGHAKLPIKFSHKNKCSKPETTTETSILINFNITGEETITSVN